MQHIVTLLIDDDEDDREVFSLALESVEQKVELITAADGYDALAMIRNCEELIPDFIFLDLNMPKIGGKECLLELKKMQRLKDVPVYIYTTSQNPKHETELLQMGATAYIIKPVEVKELADMLTEIFSKN